MSLFGKEFDRIVHSFFTNEKDESDEGGQHGSLIIKEVA